MGLPARSSSILRFGSFELDAAAAELRKYGVLLKLHPQPFRVLHLLASRPGQVVDRKELQQALWGTNTFVDFEGGLNFCIKQVRNALGDDAENPRYIETIPRRGYRFIAPVSATQISGAPVSGNNDPEHIIPFPHAPALVDTPVQNDAKIRAACDVSAIP
jgi:DNA-binding winged helix-turn-helix (wHTH) protein